MIRIDKFGLEEEHQDLAHHLNGLIEADGEIKRLARTLSGLSLAFRRGAARQGLDSRVDVGGARRRAGRSWAFPGEAITDGRTLTLQNVGVYGSDSSKLNAGVAVMRGLVRELGKEVKALGYDKLIVKGLRYTGANPGRAANITIDLTKP